MIRLIALLILGTALASCASGTHKIVDMIPEWAGGLPKGVARKARERDKRAKETRLRGWACEIRTQKCRRKLSL